MGEGLRMGDTFKILLSFTIHIIPHPNPYLMAISGRGKNVLIVICTPIA